MQQPAAVQEVVPGGRVDSIVVAGNRRITRASIVNAAAIPLRTPIGFRDIQRALRALYDTGEFDSLSVLRTVGPDSAEILVIRVAERPLLVRVTVRGADQLSERSVRDRIELPAGRPLNPGAVERARQRIDSLYEAEGYYLADVKPQVIREDSEHVRVVLDIDEGRRIAWQSRPPGFVGKFAAGRIWRYELEPVEGGGLYDEIKRALFKGFGGEVGAISARDNDHADVLVLFFGVMQQF